ncbi:heparan-alpha-glucosaminide N-acetyltransferase [Rhodanobacter aciditrophus]
MPAHRLDMKRSSLLDAYRGLAVLLMMVFHFCWDLKTFGYMSYSLQDPFWVAFRYVILTLFLSAVGWSSYVAVQGSQAPHKFLLNLSKIGLSAIAISIGSYLALPNQWIFFGILHFIFLAAILVRPFAVHPIIGCTLGVGIVVATYATPEFDPSIIRSWFTEQGAPRYTLDYISPLPWTGVVLIGLILGYYKVEHLALPKWLELKWICYLGRHALVVYLTHQLVLYPLVAGVHLISN